METKNFKTGQQWRMRGGAIATITSTDIPNLTDYKIGACFVSDGTPYSSIFKEDGSYLGSEANDWDMVELVQDVAPAEAVKPDLTTTLLEYFRASVAFNNSHGEGPEGETIAEAVERERKAEERFDAANAAAHAAVAAAGVA